MSNDDLREGGQREVKVDETDVSSDGRGLF